MMRWLLLGLAILGGIVAIVVIVGWSLPVRHTATRSITVPAPPSAVFALVSNPSEYPSWRRGVTRVEVLQADDAGQPLRFREHGSDGIILYEVVEREPDRRIVVGIADTTLPFGGRWTHEIAPAPPGATLRITEDGEVYNPVFRFMSRFVFGHTSTIDRFLSDVSARLDTAGGNPASGRR